MKDYLFESIVAGALLTVVSMFIAYIKSRDKQLEGAHKQFTVNLREITAANSAVLRRIDELLTSIRNLEVQIADLIKRIK